MKIGDRFSAATERICRFHRELTVNAVTFTDCGTRPDGRQFCPELFRVKQGYDFFEFGISAPDDVYLTAHENSLATGNPLYGAMYPPAREMIRDVKAFQEQIPLTEFHFYYDWIQRMVDDGETGLITNFPVKFFAATSGTTGYSKRVPVSENTRKRFNDYASYRALAVMHRYYKQKTGKSFPAEKGFITLEVRKRKKWNNIGGFSTEGYAEIIERHLSELNHAYGFERRNGTIGPLKLRLTNLPINALYREAKKDGEASGNQLKPLHLADTEGKVQVLEDILGDN